MRTPNRATTMIVPVLVSHPSTGEGVLTYAMLDTQSNTHFVIKQLLNSLGVSGDDTTLDLTTMNGRVKSKSEVITNLMIKSIDSSSTLTLPKCFSRDVIPCSRSCIPTSDSIKGYPHLSNINLPPHFNDALDIHTLSTEKCVITKTTSNLHVIAVTKPHMFTTVSTVEFVPTTGMTILSSDVEIKPPEVAKLGTSIAYMSKYKHFQSEELHAEATVMGIVQLLLMLLSLLRNNGNYCATYSSKNPNVDSDRVEGHPDPYNLAASEKPRFHVSNKWWVSTYGWDSSYVQELKLLLSGQRLPYSLQTSVLS